MTRLTLKLVVALLGFFFFSNAKGGEDAGAKGTRSIFTPDGIPPSSPSLSTLIFIADAGRALSLLLLLLLLPPNASAAICFNSPMREKCFLPLFSFGRLAATGSGGTYAVIGVVMVSLLW